MDTTDSAQEMQQDGAPQEQGADPSSMEGEESTQVAVEQPVESVSTAVDGATEAPPQAQAEASTEVRQLFFARANPMNTEAALTAVFDQFGVVEELILFKDRNTQGSKGCGFVKYTTRESAQAAIDGLDQKHTMEGARDTLSVKWADPELQDRRKKRSRDDFGDPNNKQLFFGRAPKTADEKEIEALFSPFGTVKEVVIFRERGGAGKGCGFVTMSTRAEAETARTAMDGSGPMQGVQETFSCQWADPQLRERTRARAQGGYPPGPGGYQYPPGQYPPYGGYPQQGYPYGAPPQGYYDAYGNWQYYPQDPYAQHAGYAQPAGPQPAAGPQQDNHQLYIGGVPHSCDEEQLSTLMQQCGSIKQIKVLRDRATNTHKGAAFVTYTQRSEAEAAIAAFHQTHTLPGNNKPMIVKFADRGQQAPAAGAPAPAAWNPPPYAAPQAAAPYHAPYGEYQAAAPYNGQPAYGQYQPPAYGQWTYQ